ncbi:MAG: bifunctional precorrin-2 dehydrogenase/sirohydrochlorin ferrochelatase [Crenarchaeota archaeon]|nr:bifunctional precorrin-2 dehydrogenase/sirohydrochlorin ferrochelatase [Thermoproteota archaeon]
MRVPLFVDPSKWTVVVFGGGGVGTRRAQKFANAGARVRVVAKEFSDKLYCLNVELVKADLSDEETIRRLVRDADLVVIATNSKEINDKIYNIANSMGKLINDATNAKRSDVHVPFETEVDGIRIAVSSEGASGVSAHIAIALIEEFLKRNKFWRNINEFARKFKDRLKESVEDPKRRFGLYWYVMMDREVVELIKEGRVEEAVELALKKALEYEGEGIRDTGEAVRAFLEAWGDELLGGAP